MKAIIIYVGFLVLCTCGYASADCNKAYASIGTGYKFDEQKFGNIDGVNIPFKNIDPLSARFEAGILCENGISFGISHHSQWRQGFPLNKDGEPYKTEFFIEYTHYWDI